MPLCMSLWWFWLRDYLVLILQQGAGFIVETFMAEKVLGLISQLDAKGENIVWLLKTSLSPINDPRQLLAIPISTNRFTVSYPLLWGLILATPGNAKIRQLISGTLILLPVTLIIALLLIQFKLALHINHQPILTEVPSGEYMLTLPYPQYLYYLMVVGRQLAMLVLPTLAPLLVWGLFNRTFILNLIFEGLLARSTETTAIAQNDMKS
jgi:hypothetical protein